MASLESDIEAMKKDMTQDNPFYNDVHRKHNEQQTTKRKQELEHRSRQRQQMQPSISNTKASAVSAPLDPPSVVEIAKQKQENRKKQETVKNAVLAKKQKLEREQEKLTKVNTELGVIENELAKDVYQLRQMIDSLSYDISYYERDYEAKKKAYLESKKLMDGLKERRANLTNHLHTIIITNEERKSEKLEYLMKELESTDESQPPSLEVRTEPRQRMPQSQPQSQPQSHSRVIPHQTVNMAAPATAVNPNVNHNTMNGQTSVQSQSQSPAMATVRNITYSGMVSTSSQQDTIQTRVQSVPASKMRNRNERPPRVTQEEKPVYRFSGFPDEALEMEDI